MNWTKKELDLEEMASATTEETKRKIFNELNAIRDKDPDKTLFYAWDRLPKYIKESFIGWCCHYMQVSHRTCIPNGKEKDGWSSGWRKYRDGYYLWLEGKFENSVSESDKVI